MVDWQEVRKIAIEKYGVNFDDYFDPTVSLSERDSEGDETGVTMVCGVRSGGKTTGFLIIGLILFREYGLEMVELYRYSYELCSCHTLFEDALNTYPLLGSEMTSKPCAKGLYYQLFLDGKPFGFAISIGSVDSLKKYSPVFANTFLIVMEEFLTEKGVYLKKEVELIESILVTLGRGKGKQSRFLKLVLLANKTVLMNPYFLYFGIYNRYNENVKILHGSGWICQFDKNQNAVKAITENKGLKAFRNSKYIESMTGTGFLIDTGTFVQKPTGRSRYCFTIVYDGEYYGVWEYYDEGYLYITTNYDKCCKLIAAFKPGDHTQNSVMISHYDFLFDSVKKAYENGYLRFSDLKCKNVIYEILAIDMYK